MLRDSARTCETCERADCPENRVRHYLDAADAWDECDECRDGGEPICAVGEEAKEAEPLVSVCVAFREEGR